MLAKKCIYCLVFLALSFGAGSGLQAQPPRPELQEEDYSTKKTIRVTDGIGKGKSKDIALQNAIIDAREKALTRVTSSFRHMLSEVKDGEFVSKSVAEDVHARIIDRDRIISVDYDHDIDFSPYIVAVVTADITVSFLDLDFFAQEIMKTAEAACVRSIVLSGWGQVFNHNYFAGISMGLLTYGSIGYAYYRESQIPAASRLAGASGQNLMRDHQNTARTFYVVGAVTWIYSIWEAFEDRERADEMMDLVHDQYFPELPYQRATSPIQNLIMQNTRPTW